MTHLPRVPNHHESPEHGEEKREISRGLSPGFGSLFVVLVQLVGIDDIVSDAVESPHDGSYRGEEGIA